MFHIFSLLSVYDTFADGRATIFTQYVRRSVSQVVLFLCMQCPVVFTLLVSLASAHRFKVHTRLRRNVNFVPCLRCHDSAVRCKRFCHTLCSSSSSGNNVAAHITNTLESAEAPVLKFNQIVKTQDHAMSELSKQSSDTLEMFSKYLTNLAASSTHLDTVQSKTPTNAWEMSQDVGVRNSWPGLDLHDFIQDLVNVLAPLQT